MTQFLYEDGLGNVVDKNVHQLQAKQLDIHVRTAQRWVKQYDERPDSIFESGEKKGRRRILTSEHKKTIIDFIDANPSAAVVEVTEHLVKEFKDLKVSNSTVNNFIKTECNLPLKKAEFQSVERKSPEKIQERFDWVRQWEQTDMNFLTNCVFLDKSAFHINMKRTRAWSKKGVPAVVTVPTTRAKTTSILEAISASGLIKVSLRIPKANPNKKRKLDKEYEVLSTGTVTGHYISFLKETLDEMDKYPQMKGHYLVMDNAPIHTNKDIANRWLKSRGRKREEKETRLDVKRARTATSSKVQGRNAFPSPFYFVPARETYYGQVITDYINNAEATVTRII
ncbi:hypothetical protein VTP01DRAFT_3858 [Rhizomucor pusillus]|uniref:uncharacterized protein n=1 Tax=Rhizomucor pusillus TaxID=4840 RepID=UPI003743A738